MQAQGTQLLYAFIVAVLVFIILAGLLARLVFLHYEKIKRMKTEKENLKMQYEQELLQAQLEIEEQTRKHLAEELHDNLGALSSLIKINLNLAARAQEAEEKDRLLQESRLLLKDLIVELKQLSVTLNADRLSLQGLPDMIRIEMGRIIKLGLFEVEYQCEVRDLTLPVDQQLIIFRICQELLHNAVKHSAASQLSVLLLQEDEFLEVIVEDNGAGFTSPNIVTGQLDGSGLLNVQNRAKLIGAKLHIQSEPGKGTRCRLRLPLTQQLTFHA